MKLKYVESKCGQLLMLDSRDGSASLSYETPFSNVDTASMPDHEAESIWKDRHELLRLITAMANEFDRVDSAAFDKFWNSYQFKKGA